MAENNSENKTGNSGFGRLVFGTLQGNGYNTDGMSFEEAYKIFEKLHGGDESAINKAYGEEAEQRINEERKSTTKETTPKKFKEYKDGLGDVEIGINSKSISKNGAGNREDVVLNIQGKTIDAYLHDKKMMFRRPETLDYKGKIVNLDGLILNNTYDDIEKEVKKQHLEFLNNNEFILQSTHYGTVIPDEFKMLDPHYSQEVWDNVFEKNKQPNPDFGRTNDDNFEIVPKIKGKDLIKLLETENEQVKKQKEELELKKKKELQNKFDEAKRTNKPVLIDEKGGMNDYNFDRGWANVTMRYAMPDGTIKTEIKKDIWD